MQGVTEQVAEDLNLAVDHGALIVEVTPDSPADKAGLRGGGTETAQGIAAGGDLIVAIDGKQMRDEDAVAAAVAAHKPGDKIEIEYYRGDAEEDDDRGAHQAAGQRRRRGARRSGRWRRQRRRRRRALSAR